MSLSKTEKGLVGLTLTAAVATTGCSTATGLVKETGSDVLGAGATEMATKTADACKENPEHNICKGTEAAGKAKDATVNALGTAKEAATDFATSTGKKAAGFLSGLIKGDDAKVDCAVKENVENPACQAQPKPAGQ